MSTQLQHNLAQTILVIVLAIATSVITSYSLMVWVFYDKIVAQIPTDRSALLEHRIDALETQLSLQGFRIQDLEYVQATMTGDAGTPVIAPDRPHPAPTQEIFHD